MSALRPFNFMKIVALLFGGVGVGLLAAGCATIAHDSRQQVNFSSTPPGALIAVDGQGIQRTPAVMALARKNVHTVRLTLDGYQPYELRLERKVSGWVWGNLAFGGVIGILVDASTGAMYKLEPSSISTALAQADPDVRAADGVLYVAVVLTAEPGLQQIGALDPLR